MLRRIFGTLHLDDTPVPEASLALEREGFAVLRGVLDGSTVDRLRDETTTVFAEVGPERGRPDAGQFRYEMFNRSPTAREAIAHPRILGAIEPLLGEDCHVIANTAWRNPPEFRGQGWHTDAGPHVPRPEGVPWDDRIPYPVFAIACHILLSEVTEAEGMTAVIPGSHRSGRGVPFDQMGAEDLTCDGRSPVPLGGAPGDVVLFVSDCWHRGLPADRSRSRGRDFLQVHYARRDIAQRVRTTAVVNHVDPAIVADLTDPRQRTLLGLHDAFFYDG